MNPPPSHPIPEQPLRFSVEAARQLLEEALEAEKSGKDAEAELAHMRATAAAEHKQAG